MDGGYRLVRVLWEEDVVTKIKPELWTTTETWSGLQQTTSRVQITMT